MASKDSGFFDNPFSRTRSIIRNSIESRATVERARTRHLSHQYPTTSNSARWSTSKTDTTSPVKRKRMTFHKRKGSKSGTVLRAVPSNAACAAALLQQVQAMPTEDMNPYAGRTSAESELQSPTRSLFHHDHARVRRRSNSTNALPSPTKAGAEMQCFASSPSLSGVIGTYKDGRVQWDQKNGRRPISARSHRPQIQVVIPAGISSGKPLPMLPAFEGSINGHVMSAASDTGMMYNVSPPSVSKEHPVRHSMVSPLSTQQYQPPYASLYPKITIKLPKPDHGSPELCNGASTSSEDSRDDDASSTYSHQSSVTSVEEATVPTLIPMQIHGRTVSQAFSITSPVKAGIFDSPPHKTSKSEDAETGHRVAPPPRPSRVYGIHPPIEEDFEFVPTCALRPLRNASNPQPNQLPTVLEPPLRSSSVQSSKEMGVIMQAINRTASDHFSSDLYSSDHFTSGLASPTLSEAEDDLERHLTSFTDDSPFKWDDVVVRQNAPTTPQGLARQDSITFPMNHYSPPPQVPRKSSKRQAHSVEGFRMSRVPCDHIASQMMRRSLMRRRTLTINIPETKRMTSDDFILSPLPIPSKDVKRMITPENAEMVILSILQGLESLDDLFACAVVNSGFYRVFQRHELELMKAVLRKMSPPAWEHREICYPGHDRHDEEDLDRPRQEYTPMSYIRHYTRDMYIIAAIKSLIKTKCESFLRPEISFAIVSEDPEESARVDDALWRIWTFCKIFGSGKGREEDITAQMDWLQGGVLVHQQTCAFGAPMWDDMSETLASAPECFAKGNEGGLTAEELFDIMELWNCLGVLLQPIEGRTIQAREYGLFDKTDIRGGDIDGEEMMLDEWYYYLLTLGLSTILDLSVPCTSTDPSVFILASQNGWDNWTPPVIGGTRRNFLKEAAYRVYEDKIAHTYAETSTKEVQRALSKQRMQQHISDLRNRKNNGERRAEITMSQERPMSEWEGVISNLTRSKPRPVSSNLVTHIPSLRPGVGSSSLAQELSVSIAELPAARTPPPPQERSQSPPRRTVAQPLLPSPPPSTIGTSTRDRSSMASSNMPSIMEHPAFRRQGPIPELPSIEDHPMFTSHLRSMSDESDLPPSRAGSASCSSEGRAAFQQHPLQQAMQADRADNSADRAVHRIVEMGFTPEQARQALRQTDLGDGLRVDRAVELLLRNMAL